MPMTASEHLALQDAARAFADAFVDVGRGDYMKPEAPYWAKLALCKASGYVPSNWYFREVRRAANTLAEALPMDWADAQARFANAYSDRGLPLFLEWLNTPGAIGYCDAAARDGWVTANAPMWERIFAGMRYAHSEVFRICVQAVEEHARELLGATTVQPPPPTIP